jgi:DNA-binding transcriptional LysR family regulator
MARYSTEKKFFFEFLFGESTTMPRPSRLSFELLETFVTLIEREGDASKAASSLEINQPSMSKRLAQLQNAGASIRSPWLERRGRRWELTEEGRRVLPAVQAVVHRYRALGDFAGGESLSGSEVTFACGQQAVTTFVLDALLRFRRERPDVRFRISTMRGKARIEGVANGHLDLATVTFSEREIRTIARRSLHVERLRDEPFVLVAGKSAKGEWREAFEALPDGPISAESLCRFPLILPEPNAGVREFLDRGLEAAGVADRLQVIMEIGGWSTIRALVRAGIGVGIVSQADSGDQKGLLPTRVLDPKQIRPIQLHLICRKHVQAGDKLDLSDDAERFREHLVSAGRG